jgi:hypothetical protein
MDFFEFLKTLPGILIILFVGLIWLITSVTDSWAKHWRAVRMAAATTELKLRMIERGMSAEEIRKVVASGADEEEENEPSGLPPSPKGKSALQTMIENGAESESLVKVIEAGLPIEESINDVARWMAENSYEGADIAAVIAALRTAHPTTPATAAQPARPLPDFQLEVRAPQEPALPDLGRGPS